MKACLSAMSYHVTSVEVTGQFCLFVLPSNMTNDNHQNNYLSKQITVKNLQRSQLFKDRTIKVRRMGLAGVTRKRDAGTMRLWGFGRNQSRQLCRQRWTNIWATDSVNGRKPPPHITPGQSRNAEGLMTPQPCRLPWSLSALQVERHGGSVREGRSSFAALSCLQSHGAKLARAEQHIFFRTWQSLIWSQTFWQINKCKVWILK